MNPWTNHEVRNLHAFCGEGISDATLAKKLGRSVMAIRRKRHGLGIFRSRRRVKVQPPTETVKRETMVVEKSRLPAYYEAGWQVVWFGGNSVGIEWRNASTPRFIMVCPSSATIGNEI